jgi:hypothetical protein
VAALTWPVRSHPGYAHRARSWRPDEQVIVLNEQAMEPLTAWIGGAGRHAPFEEP